MNYGLKRINEFDPNTPEAKAWATFIPGRRPAFKAHTKRPTALTALTQHSHVLLFQFQNGRWVQVVRKAREDHNCTCTVCGGPTTVITHWGWHGSNKVRDLGDGRIEVDVGKFKWQRDRAGRIADPLTLMYLCETCAPLFK